MRAAEVEVRWLRLDLLRPEGQARLPVTEEERLRAAAFRREEDRRRFLLARGLLRALLARGTGRDPLGLAFDRTCRHCGSREHGKPRLVGEGSEGWRFSVSHSGVVVVVALARGLEVGVDVERVDPSLDVEGVARVALAPGERAVLAGLPPAARAERFCRLWTRKEAYLKVRGYGLGLPPERVDLSALPPEGGVLEGVHVAPLDLAPGHAAALAAEGPFLLRAAPWTPA